MSVKGGCLQKTAICFLCPFLCEATVFVGKISTDVTVSTAFYPLAINASTLAHTKSSRVFFPSTFSGTCQSVMQQQDGKKGE